MKLYVLDNSRKKLYLELVASSKKELASKLGSDSFSVKGVTYQVSDVIAEHSKESTPSSMVIGGALGIFGGVAGVIAGGIIGGLLGNEVDNKEKALVEAFNRS